MNLTVGTQFDIQYVDVLIEGYYANMTIQPQVEEQTLQEKSTLKKKVCAATKRAARATCKQSRAEWLVTENAICFICGRD